MSDSPSGSSKTPAQLERDVAELQQRLVERTAAYEKKDAAQVREIAQLRVRVAALERARGVK